MMRALDTFPVAYMLAGLLAWKYGSKGGAIFPSQETLARHLGVTERHVRRVLQVLIPLGLKVEIRRGPRTGKTMSYYSFGDPTIPDIGDPNSGASSGHKKPKSAQNSGRQRQQFRTFEHQNSGHGTPPNQQIDPKEGSNRESALARAALSGPPDSDLDISEVKEGEIQPPKRAPGHRTAASRQLEPSWQPSVEDLAYAAVNLPPDVIARETQSFRDHGHEYPRMTFRKWLARAIEHEASKPNVRPESVGLGGFLHGVERGLAAKKGRL